MPWHQTQYVQKQRQGHILHILQALRKEFVVRSQCTSSAAARDFPKVPDFLGLRTGVQDRPVCRTILEVPTPRSHQRC